MSSSEHGKIMPLILAGGSGTRLWSLSRKALPKRFVLIFGELSSFQKTVHRVRDRRVFDDPVEVSPLLCGAVFASKQRRFRSSDRLSAEFLQ
jgi:mannose-1-phosphate guanylyltransferase